MNFIPSGTRANVRDAYRILALTGPIDCLLADVEMQGTKDGAILAEWIASVRPEIHVVLTSGSAFPIEAFRSGVISDFLSKPFTAGQLLHKLDRIDEVNSSVLDSAKEAPVLNGG